MLPQQASAEEASLFLDWLADAHFVFQGYSYCRYERAPVSSRPLALTGRIAASSDSDQLGGVRFDREAGLGILPGLGGTQLLTRAVGPRRAIELLTTAQPFSAEQALDWGLVSGIVPPDALMDTALGVAKVIASKAPLSVRGAKRVVHEGQDLDLKRAMDLELSVYNHLFTTQDRREGVASFNERRTPVFEGR